MCFERLIALKCGHYESYQIDQAGCKDKAGRKCPAYLQMIIRQDKNRSCINCKAALMTTLGVRNPSLRNICGSGGRVGKA